MALTINSVAPERDSGARVTPLTGPELEGRSVE
jgi:hypothetical protein